MPPPTTTGTCAGIVVTGSSTSQVTCCALAELALTLEMKCAGLDAEAMARRSVEPSTMSLLGLVRHLAEMERATFRVMMAGAQVPRLFCSDTDRDGDFDGMIYEYARHMGHADLLRERIDGRIGQ